MNNMDTSVIAAVAITCYLIGGFIAGIRFFVSGSGELLPRGAGISFGLVGAVIHMLFLHQSILGETEINLGFFDAASIVSWAIVVLLMILELFKPVYNLSIIVLPTAACAIILQIWFPAIHFLDVDASWDLRIHGLISLLAFSLLMLASVQAVLLAIQDHQLRTRQPGRFVYAMPPLQTMETLLFIVIGLGFALLTVAMISGFIFQKDVFLQQLWSKKILSFIAWLLFGILLWGHHRFGWRGKTPLISTLLGFVVLSLAYL